MVQKTKFIMKAPLHEAADKILNISGQNSCLAPLAACILPVLEDLLIHSFEALLLIKKSGFFTEPNGVKCFKLLMTLSELHEIDKNKKI